MNRVYVPILLFKLTNGEMIQIQAILNCVHNLAFIKKDVFSGQGISLFKVQEEITWRHNRAGYYFFTWKNIHIESQPILNLYILHHGNAILPFFPSRNHTFAATVDHMRA